MSKTCCYTTYTNAGTENSFTNRVCFAEIWGQAHTYESTVVHFHVNKFRYSASSVHTAFEAFKRAGISCRPVSTKHTCTRGEAYTSIAIGGAQGLLAVRLALNLSRFFTETREEYVGAPLVGTLGRVYLRLLKALPDEHPLNLFSLAHVAFFGSWHATKTSSREFLHTHTKDEWDALLKISTPVRTASLVGVSLGFCGHCSPRELRECRMCKPVASLYARLRTPLLKRNHDQVASLMSDYENILKTLKGDV